MESLIFKLEKVIVSHSEEPKDFEGPLDLILFLLSKNKMNIQDISLSLICDQYLAWLKRRQNMDLEIASEFIMMASHLVYLKTRMLLSIDDQETKNEVDALIESLEKRQQGEIYTVVQKMTALLASREQFGQNIFIRPPESGKPEISYLYNQDKEDLLKAFISLCNRSEQLTHIPQADFHEIAQFEPYPVETKVQEILGQLRERGKTRFLQLFRNSHSRSEIVATFLAVLELCRAHLLCLSDSDSVYAVCQTKEQSITIY